MLIKCWLLFPPGDRYTGYPGPLAGGAEHDRDAGHHGASPSARCRTLLHGPLRAVRTHNRGAGTNCTYISLYYDMYMKLLNLIFFLSYLITLMFYLNSNVIRLN